MLSSLRRCAVSIKQPNEVLVKATMEALAKFLNGQVVTQIEDYSGVWAKVVSGVMVPGEGGIRGFGVTITGGQVAVVGDDYRQQMSIETFKKLFENFYTSVAVQRALNAMGYQTNANIMPNKNIVIRGVKGAGYIG